MREQCTEQEKMELSYMAIQDSKHRTKTRFETQKTLRVQPCQQQRSISEDYGVLHNLIHTAAVENGKTMSSGVYCKIRVH